MSVPKKEEYMKALATELHKPVRKVKQRRRVHATSRDQIWSMDLVDMGEWAKENDGEKYLLCVVDVFSRYAWVRPQKSKSGTDTFAAFISIVEDAGTKPEKLWVDRGSEFYNSIFKKWCATNGVTMYSTFGESKSVIVERFNRTLKTVMWHNFTEYNTRRWVDTVQGLVDEYNRRKHSSLGMSPMEARKKKNFVRVLKKMAPSAGDKKGVRRNPEFVVGDKVRISRLKGTFEKGYHANWSQETFTVVGVRVPYDSSEPITYNLQDRSGEEIVGSFYAGELQKAKYPDVLLVEEVLKSRRKKDGSGKEHFVKWLGYSTRWNSWVDEEDILDFLGPKPKFGIKAVEEDRITLRRIR